MIKNRMLTAASFFLVVLASGTIQDLRYYSIAIPYERALRAIAPDLHPDFNASITQRAIEWCQIALMHMRVLPGSKNFGRLTFDEIDIWRQYSCSQHFCRSKIMSTTTARSKTFFQYVMGKIYANVSIATDVRWGTSRVT